MSKIEFNLNMRMLEIENLASGILQAVKTLENIYDSGFDFEKGVYPLCDAQDYNAFSEALGEAHRNIVDTKRRLNNLQDRVIENRYITVQNIKSCEEFKNNNPNISTDDIQRLIFGIANSLAKVFQTFGIQWDDKSYLRDIKVQYGFEHLKPDALLAEGDLTKALNACGELRSVVAWQKEWESVDLKKVVEKELAKRDAKNSTVSDQAT